ncbi:MAG: two-component regulator propeller domain-containing protein, partial [Shewanella sp.]|uniref:ligand-binding sensor domain-containing protein n=1 Tax=Shewanella sp. TaxID=50422 RepID=UPI003C74F362
MPKILLFICVCIFISPFAAAIETENADSNFDLLLNHTNYGVADGLSQDTVTAIVEDKEGYVWVGTINGLNRFDGNEFKQFYAGDDGKSLPSSFIRNLLIDDNGTLLVGTDKGLVEFNEETESFHPNSISAQIGDQAIWSISKQDNEILIGLNNKFLSYDSKTLVTNYLFENENINEIKNIINFNNKFFLRNYEGELFTLNDGTLVKISSKTNDIILLSNKVITIKNDGIYDVTNTIKKLSNIIMTSIDSSAQGNATSIDDNNVYEISYKDIFKIKKIGTLLIEKEKLKKTFIKKTNNTIYISNYNDGFTAIAKNKNYVNRINIKKNNIWSITSYNKNIYLVGDDNNLSVFNENLQIIKEMQLNIPHGPKS